jgi:5-formyltetrahydrofolate cyclo-ligase
MRFPVSLDRQHEFESKEAARRAVWEALEQQGVARFPFPVQGRIPNFAGAREAAERLFAIPELAAARRIKVNPDSPQKHVRELALRRGIVVYMPTPRLRGGFRKLNPRRIPSDKIVEAANLKTSVKWAEDVPLAKLPRMDFIVTGSVAVTRDGRRCGKGHGYGDLEYSILRELGHAAVPVATTVHPLQIVDAFPADPHDLPVDWIATPEELLEVPSPPTPPSGIDWGLLSEEIIAQMPVLAELRKLREGRRKHTRVR